MHVYVNIHTVGGNSGTKTTTSIVIGLDTQNESLDLIIQHLGIQTSPKNFLYARELYHFVR